MTQDPSGSSAKHQVKDVLFFVCVCVSVYLKEESFSIRLWKFSSVISLRISLWLTWSEQEGQYGLSWHQSDIAAAPFCPMSHFMFVRSCQLKSSVTFRPLTCHFASPTQTSAQKRPQPSIYPRAWLSFLPSSSSRSSRYKSRRRVHGLAYHPQIVLQMETITYLEPSASNRCCFHTEGEGARHPKSTESLSRYLSSDLWPLNPFEDWVGLRTHMLITNLEWCIFLLLLNSPFPCHASKAESSRHIYDWWWWLNSEKAPKCAAAFTH